MANINLTLRRQKGTHLTIDEADANFSNLRNAIIAEEAQRIQSIESLELSLQNESEIRDTTLSNIDDKLNQEIEDREILANNLSANYFNKVESDARYINVTGDSLNGDIIFGNKEGGAFDIETHLSYGLRWNKHTDSARITFFSYGDGVAPNGDSLSNLAVFLGDNGVEGFGIWSYDLTKPNETGGVGANIFYVNSNKITYKGKKIWHEDNDGSGSGLDADTLDGLQATSFASSVHNHNDIYYTKSEITNNYYTKAQTDSAFSAITHTHSQYFITNSSIFPTGTISNPSVKIRSSSTGLYSADSSQIGITIEGSYIGQFNSNGDFISKGNITGYSDIRLKDQLEKITNALEKVKSLNGYSYTRRDTGERQIGLIAQEVESIVPEVVTKTDEYMSLAYGNLVGVLVEAIKELSSKLDSVLITRDN